MTGLRQVLELALRIPSLGSTSLSAGSVLSQMISPSFDQPQQAIPANSPYICNSKSEQVSAISMGPSVSPTEFTLYPLGIPNPHLLTRQLCGVRLAGSWECSRRGVHLQCLSLGFLPYPLMGPSQLSNLCSPSFPTLPFPLYFSSMTLSRDAPGAIPPELTVCLP